MRPPASPSDLVRQATALLEQGQYKVAEKQLKSVLRSSPNHGEALVVLGVLCGMRGRLTEAVKHLSRAAKFNPSNDSAHYNLGQALIRLDRHEDAVAPLLSASKLANRPEIFEKLGDCLSRTGKLDEAVTNFTRAVELTGDAGTGASYGMLLSSLIEAKRRIGDWEDLEKFEQRLISALAAGSTAEPLLLLYMTDDPPLHKTNAVRYATKYLAPIFENSKPAAPFVHVPRDRSRIRLGYLSTDFRNHATARLIAGMIEAHDQERFEVFGLSIGRNDRSPMRQRLANAFDRFVDLSGVASPEVARRIHALGIDILVDLNGYIAGSRPEILAARPAPIQCHFLAFPGTLGLPCIDYMIVDPIIVPHKDSGNFTEALVRLPHTYQPTDNKRPISDAPTTRADHGLPEDAFVYCAFNAAIKITPQMFDVWMRIMAATPTSVLWLFSDTEWLATNLRQQAATRGIDPDRLIFADFADQAEHLARLRHADLFLDTFPYTAHTTASDALWAGLPVLTYPGKSFASRVGASILNAVGLPELIMPSLEAYENEAIRLAQEPQRLQSIRDHLQQNLPQCALFDTLNYARAIENAFAGMWSRWQGGEPPAQFDVDTSTAN